MKTSKSLLAGLALAVGALTGCGGGSGGDKENAPTSVNLSGNAAKGTLIGADVKAYEIINGLKSNSVWASATTDASGAYTLSGKPTTNPVVVEVAANATTTMLDEAQIEVDGTFKQVAAPSNLSLRSFVPSMTEGTNVQINPITEAAVAVANASVETGKLTVDVLNAAKQVALQMAPADTNPFSQKPPLKATDMSSEQIKFSAMMAGLMKSADSSCDLSCQVTNLSKNIKISVGSDGKGTLATEAASAIQDRRTDLLTQGQKAWLENTNNANRMGEKLSEVKTATNSAISASKNNAVPTSTKTATEFAEAEGLEGFITALRNGFKATEKNLLQANDELNRKYQTLTLTGTQEAKAAIKSVGSDCFEGKTTFACTTSSDSYSNITWTQNGDTWTGKATTFDQGTWESTVKGSIVDGVVNVTLNAETKSSSGKLLTKIENMSVVLSQDSTTKAGSFNATGVIRAYAANDLTISLTAKDWKGTLSKKTDTPQKMTLAGEVTLAVSNGDILQGTLAASGNTIQITKTFNWCITAANNCEYSYSYTESNLTDLDLHLTSVNNNSQLLKLDVTGTQIKSDKIQPESASNFNKYSLETTAVLTQSLTLKINSNQSEAFSENIAITIASGGSEVKVSGLFTAPVTGNNSLNTWCVAYKRCANQLNLTSANNVYTAKLTRLNGKPQADIYKGTTQVGVIKDGIFQINGRDVSIY